MKLHRSSWLLVLMSLTSIPCAGYLSSYAGYQALVEGSDLIVVATPEFRRELPGPAELPGVRTNAGAVPAIEIETTFRLHAVLKGQLEAQSTFVLVHYREADRPPGLVTAGPLLIDFEAGDQSAYLMFLSRRPDGRFQAFQDNEPGWCILRLPHGDRP